MAFVPGPKASRASGGDRGLLSRLEVPTRTKGPPFVPVGGSTWDKRPNPFIPVGNTNPDKKGDTFIPVGGTNPDTMTLLSRLVLPTRAPPRDSSKGSYYLLSHMYYLGELARKPCARQEVLGSNPAGCKKNFSVWDI